MQKENPLQLQKERRTEMITGIREYFSRERGEEIGDLAAALMLDFIAEQLGPEFYNKGVEDAYRYMKDATEDLLSIRRS